MAAPVKQSQALLTLIGVAVHVVVLLSVFDIYFQSPVLSAVPAEPPSGSLPDAARLVLFVADGLRADKCFGGRTADGRWAAPHLRSVATAQGAWGVSHTRVPTESRPGHVALIAGLYEDVSAVTRGWKENPVDFDSVFNRSRFTWSWGSPDILPMFAKGASGSRVFTHSYSSQEENFADSDPSRLDTWVFDRFEEFLESARNNATVRAMLEQDRIVFFLHLLGLDTIGHSSKPWSREYVEAIRLVDDGIVRVTRLLDRFYLGDQRTSFLFTSDHGMTDWGSHGASDPEETRTPLLLWGAGVRQPLQRRLVEGVGDTPADWQLGDVSRTDINQADIAPLMSTLLGISIPVNSEGVLPVELLSGDSRTKARALLVNARQLAAHFRRHWHLKEASALPMLFRPFGKFTPKSLENTFEHILDLIDSNKSNEAIEESREAIEGILEGINYFRTYYRAPLSASVIFGFLGWMSYLACWLGEGHARRTASARQLPPAGPSRGCPTGGARLLPNLCFAMLACLVIVLSYIKQDPPTYYLYYLLPVCSWFLVNGSWSIVVACLTSSPRIGRWTSLGYCAILLVAIELLVLAFFVRESLSVLLLALAVWPLCTPLKQSSKLLCLCWLASLLVLATFPLLPPAGKITNYPIVYLAGFIALGTYAVAFLSWITSSRNESQSSQPIGIIQAVLLAMCTVNVWFVADSVASKTEVSFLSHCFSWITLASTFVLPLLGSPSIVQRLLHIGLALMTPYVLLSTSYEAFYFLVLQLLLAAWFLIEFRLGGGTTSQLKSLTFGSETGKQSRNSIWDDVRRAYFSLLLLVTSFFGLGNTANINSFSPSSVYCFLTVFSPFVMGFLLIVKILIPFLAIAVVLRAIQVAQNRSPGHLFWAILLLSDVMVMNCFYAVRDQGSWLDIGSSIGRFVVVMTSAIAFMLLYALATLLTDLVWTLPKRHAS